MSLKFRYRESLFIIMEPTNIQKMKALEPFMIDIPPGVERVGIVLTPDRKALEEKLNIALGDKLSISEVEKALEECKDLPEVYALKIVDGVMRKL